MLEMDVKAPNLKFCLLVIAWKKETGHHKVSIAVSKTEAQQKGTEDSEGLSNETRGIKR